MPDTNVSGTFTVNTCSTRRSYRVRYYGDASAYNSCTCTDFRSGVTKRCSHIEAVAAELASAGKEAPSLPAAGELDIDYSSGRRLRLRTGRNNSRAMALAAMRYFDDDMFANEGMTADLPRFVANAREIDSAFRCTPEAANMIVDIIDRQRRRALADRLRVVPLRERICDNYDEEVRRCFVSGRAVVSAPLGAFEAGIAFGTARMLASYGLVSSVLMVCPPSLTVHWRQMLADLAGADAVMIEGDSEERRRLYASAPLFKIVSYSTLAADIKQFGQIDADMLIACNVWRMLKRDPASVLLLRRVDSDFTFVLAGCRVMSVADRLKLLRCIDPYANEADLSPDTFIEPGKDYSTEAFLFLPLTARQQGEYDDSKSTLLRIMRKYRSAGVLTHKDRHRLLTTFGRLRQACTAALAKDGKSNSLKVLETIETVDALLSSGCRRVMVVSEWERTCRYLVEQLRRNDIKAVMLDSEMPRQKRASTAAASAVTVASAAALRGLKTDRADAAIFVDGRWDLAEGTPNDIADKYVYMTAEGTIEQEVCRHQQALGRSFVSLKRFSDTITVSDSRLEQIIADLTALLCNAEENGKTAGEVSE